MQDMGTTIKTVRALSPQAKDAGAVNGVGIDRSDFYDAIAAIEVGATSGSPTSFTVDAKIQDSDDDSTYADVAGLTMAQIAAVDSHGEINFKLHGLRQFHRIVVTPAFVGGTSPDVLVSATLVMGAARNNPV